MGNGGPGVSLSAQMITSMGGSGHVERHERAQARLSFLIREPKRNPPDECLRRNTAECPARRGAPLCFSLFSAGATHTRPGTIVLGWLTMPTVELRMLEYVLPIIVVHQDDVARSFEDTGLVVSGCVTIASGGW